MIAGMSTCAVCPCACVLVAPASTEEDLNSGALKHRHKALAPSSTVIELWRPKAPSYIVSARRTPHPPNLSRPTPSALKHHNIIKAISAKRESQTAFQGQEGSMRLHTKRGLAVWYVVHYVAYKSTFIARRCCAAASILMQDSLPNSKSTCIHIFMATWHGYPRQDFASSSTKM